MLHFLLVQFPFRRLVQSQQKAFIPIVIGLNLVAYTNCVAQGLVQDPMLVWASSPPRAVAGSSIEFECVVLFSEIGI
ncbi:hypothetical protein D3C76_1662670 [compost metagenome]